MIGWSICKGGGRIDSHVETEAESSRYIVKLIKKVGIIKYCKPLFRNKGGIDDEKVM